MYIFLVTLLGLVLRLTFIVKPEGLWNDEYVSWIIASTPFNQGFWTEILKQCHMPLYYMYLKPFAHCPDLILRLSSVIPSVLAIPVMYYVGKEYSEKCSKFCAIITATLPFLVYYSQEVRFYSLVFLLSALILLFIIRCIKCTNKFNIIFYSLFSLLLVFTHVLGIIYVFFATVYLFYKKNRYAMQWILLVLIFSLIVFPFGVNILHQLPSSQWWGNFSYTNILFLFSDFLSPILTNNVNAPSIFFYKKDWFFILLITMPTLISIYGIMLGLKKIKGLLIVALIFVSVIAVLAITGNLVFITKYVIEILPIIILSMSISFSKGNFNKILFYFLITVYLLSIVTPYYPSKIFRSEGHRLPAMVLNKINPNNIIFTYYAPDRFSRYLNIKSNNTHISKINRFEYLEDPSKILNNIKPDETVAIVFLDSVSFIPESMLNYSKEINIPEMFITFSEIRHKMEHIILKRFTNISVTKLGSWTVISGKLKN